QEVSAVTPRAGPTPSPLLLATPPSSPVSTLAAEAPALGPVPTASIPPMPPREPASIERERGTLEADAIGTIRAFQVADLEAAGYRQVQATLQYASERVAMWVEEGADASREGLAASARAIEEQILPALARIYHGGSGYADLSYAVLNVQTSGASGYYAAPDGAEHPRAPAVLVMNLAAAQPGTERYDGILAHEMQHVFQADIDPNEAAWVTEGASQLLETLAGYPPPMGAVRAFAASPGVQLNTWSAANEAVFRHYGASFLMLQYLYEQYGMAGLQALLNAPEEGTAAFDRVLATLDGSTFRDLYADWAVANLMDVPGVLDGRRGYAEIDLSLVPQTSVSAYPAALSLSMPPYATRYVELLPPTGPALTLTMRLDGPAWTRLVPADAPSGTSVWWSNRGDAGHSWLERRIDLRGATHATLTYDLWYDIEWGWDWAGVRVSMDEGEHWTWVAGLHSVTPPPGSVAPHVAYTGRSSAQGGPDGSRVAEWVKERVDLSPYAGREILVRFDMVTDDALNEPGLCIDNLAIDAIGWRDEHTVADDAWVASGFARIDNRLPLVYVVQVVRYAGDEVVIQRLEATGGHGEWRLPDLGGVTDRAVLLISALTEAGGPLSTEEVGYTLSIEPAR
ncbi:MAG: hypothetical protein ACYCYF_08455, partial [Anaerolineae bacterium]